ncbi:MAG TPA: recombinase family protein [bacterium]|nr:recombinase family protein [bacterium]
MDKQINQKAVLYARVSSKEQEQEGYSIPAQLKLLKEYAEKNNLRIVRVFEDIETAKQSGRTYFNEMTNYLQEHSDTRIILVEKTDRLYRNFRDYIMIDDLDVEIHLVKESEVLSKDSKSHQKFIHGIKVLMAKNYIDNLSEEVKKGMLQKAESGDFPSVASLGYRNNKETKLIEVDESKKFIIQKLFRLYATGNYSLSQIKDMANEEGLRTKNGSEIYKSGVEHILKNPIYYGDFKWNGKMYKGNHSPIISKELFDTVQEAFAKHNRSRPRKHNFAFTGLLTCGRCGCAITAELKKKKYIYYRCTGFRGKCGNSYVREEVLDAKLGELVKAVQIDEKVVKAVREALLSSHKDEKVYHDKQISLLNKRYSKLQHRIDQIYIDKLDGNISEEFYKDKVNEWKEEQEKILEQLKNHQNANSNYFAEGIHILELAQKVYSLYLKQKHTEKRKLLNYLLSNCTLDGVSLYPVYRKPFNWLIKGGEKGEWLPWLDDFRKGIRPIPERLQRRGKVP